MATPAKKAFSVFSWHFWENLFLSLSKKGKAFLSRIEIKVAIRGGVAAGLSWFIGVWFSQTLAHPNNLVSGIWCVLTAIVVLQAHLGGTYKAAWLRFLGVILGSFVGAICTSAFGAHPLTLGLSVILTICLLSLLNLKDSIRIACMSLSVVMILWGLNSSTSPWTFAFFRTIDSVLGILVAVVVAHTLWPSEATQIVRQQMARVLNLSGKMYRQMLTLEGSEEEFKTQYLKILNEADSLIVSSREFLAESKLELLIKSSSIDRWENLIEEIEKIFQVVQNTQGYRQYHLQRIFDEDLSHHLEQVINVSELAFQELSRSLLTGEKVESMSPVLVASDALYLDLERFRTTRATRKFNFEDLENYFVFFFNLKQVVDELVEIEQKINGLNKSE